MCDYSTIPKSIRIWMQDNNIIPFQKFRVCGWNTKFWIDDKGKLYNEHEMSPDTAIHTMFSLLTGKVKISHIYNLTEFNSEIDAIRWLRFYKEG